MRGFLSHHSNLCLLPLLFSVIWRGYLRAGETSARPGNARPVASENRPGLLTLGILDSRGPRAARVTISDSGGRPIAGLPGLGWLWIDGVLQARLAPGLKRITVSSGPGMARWQTYVTIDPARPVTRNVVMGRAQTLAGRAWRACDPYVRARADSPDMSGYSYHTLSEIALAARGEGLSVVGIDDAWQLHSRGGKYADLPDARRRLTLELLRLRAEGFIAMFTHRLTAAGLGTLYLLEPMPVPPTGDSEISPARILEQLQEAAGRGALTVLGRLPTGEEDYARLLVVTAFLTGNSVDCLDLGRQDARMMALWYTLLASGYRVAVTGGGPARARDHGLDLPTTGCFLQLPGKLNTHGVLQALKRGRCVVSNGPMLSLKVNGRDPGSTMEPGPRPCLLQVRAEASSTADDIIRRVDVIYNGQVLRSIRGARAQKRLVADLHLRLPEPGWIVARYYSTNRHSWAVTNPVYLRLRGSTPRRTLLTRIHLRLVDEARRRPLAGKVEIWNHGARMEQRVIPPQGMELLLPLSARLRISSPAYNQREITLLSDEALLPRIRRLAGSRPWKRGGRDNRPRSCLVNELRTLLSTCRLEIGLRPEPAAGERR